MIIILNGPPGCGKDFAGEYLVREFKAERRAFADTLKQRTCALLGTPHSWKYYEETKNHKHPDFFGLSPREAYIWVSEGVLKPKFGKECLAKMWIEAFKNSQIYNGDDHHIVVTDCGFEEELDVFWRYLVPEHKLLLVRISAQGKDYSADSRGYVGNYYKMTRHFQICDIWNDMTPSFTKQLHEIIFDAATKL